MELERQTQKIAFKKETEEIKGLSLSLSLSLPATGCLNAMLLHTDRS